MLVRPVKRPIEDAPVRRPSTRQPWTGAREGSAQRGRLLFLLLLLGVCWGCRRPGPANDPRAHTSSVVEPWIRVLVKGGADGRPAFAFSLCGSNKRPVVDVVLVDRVVGKHESERLCTVETGTERESDVVSAGWVYGAPLDGRILQNCAPRLDAGAYEVVAIGSGTGRTRFRIEASGAVGDVETSCD